MPASLVVRIDGNASAGYNGKVSTMAVKRQAVMSLTRRPGDCGAYWEQAMRYIGWRE